MPNCGFLPHTSQTDAIALSLCARDSWTTGQTGGTGKATSDRSTIPAVGVLQSLAPADLRRVVSTYRDALRNHQEELNRLNVYPVPDGDTGTNMALTLESVVGELAAATARTWRRCARRSGTARSWAPAATRA